MKDVYPQLYGQFVPYLSMIDLIFDRGKERLFVMMKKEYK